MLQTEQVREDRQRSDSTGRLQTVAQKDRTTHTVYCHAIVLSVKKYYSITQLQYGCTDFMK